MGHWLYIPVFTTHLQEDLLKQVPEYEDIDLEGVVGDGSRQLRDVLITAKTSQDKFVRAVRRDVRGYPEVHKVIFDRSRSPWQDWREAREVWKLMRMYWMETFWI